MVILGYVRTHGHDWKSLSKQLQSRTPHAIRNRYHRLQTMALDTVGLDASVADAASVLVSEPPELMLLDTDLSSVDVDPDLSCVDVDPDLSSVDVPASAQTQW